MDSPDVLLVGYPLVARLAFTAFHFRAPKNRHSEIPGFRPASDVLEIGPEWRRLRRDAGAETGPEAANAAAWGGLGRRVGPGAARIEKIPGAERRGRQNFRNSVFQKYGPSKSFGERLKSPKRSISIVMRAIRVTSKFLPPMGINS
jgi:hypothetical protein